MSADFAGRKKMCKRECCFHCSKRYIPSFTKKNIPIGQSTKKENDLKSQNTKINPRTPSKRKAKGKTVKAVTQKEWDSLMDMLESVITVMGQSPHIAHTNLISLYDQLYSIRVIGKGRGK